MDSLADRFFGNVLDTCGDPVEWAGLSRFERLRRFVMVRNVDNWLAID